MTKRPSLYPAVPLLQSFSPVILPGLSFVMRKFFSPPRQPQQHDFSPGAQNELM